MSDRRGARRPPHFDLGRTPYFATTRVADSHSLVGEEFGEIAVQQLLGDRDRYGFLLLAYVFMPDHAHFVIVPADGHTISSTMRVVKGGIARRLNLAMGIRGSIWQAGFYDKVAHTLGQLNAHIEYTHGNPAAAGLVSRDEHYPFSSEDGSCLADYQRFLNEPFVPDAPTARAEKPALQARDGRAAR